MSAFLRFVIWWLFGFAVSLATLILHDKEDVKLKELLACIGFGFFGPFILIFVGILVTEKYKDIVVIKIEKD